MSNQYNTREGAEKTPTLILTPGPPKLEKDPGHAVHLPLGPVAPVAPDPAVVAQETEREEKEELPNVAGLRKERNMGRESESLALIPRTVVSVPVLETWTLNRIPVLLLYERRERKSTQKTRRGTNEGRHQ